MKQHIKLIALLLILIGITSCNDERILDQSILNDYIELNSDRELADLVACAGGRALGLLGMSTEPTDVFFYPINGARDFRYFEAENIADSSDFTKYIEKKLDDEPVFNGYLWKFNNLPFSGEKMGVVTYKTEGKLHVCTPIRQKTNTKPTEVDNGLGEVLENGTTPSFIWEDGEIEENVIYFQVISDEDNNFISGTYTIEKDFTFYDLSNVVFNITNPSISPTLEPNKNYNFTLMGVSEDNWVNLFIQKEFTTY